jgi:hypothetical protein
MDEPASVELVHGQRLGPGAHSASDLCPVQSSAGKTVTLSDAFCAYLLS